MVSLGTLVDMRESYGPQIIRRFNLFPTATITGSSVPGVSSGEALNLMERYSRSASVTAASATTGAAFRYKKSKPRMKP